MVAALGGANVLSGRHLQERTNCLPIALVQQGTTSSQRVFTGTLATIEETVRREKPAAPTLIIVGEVVRLQEKLSWYRAPE